LNKSLDRQCIDTINSNFGRNGKTGGGVAVIHKSNIEVKRSKHSQTFSHFELLDCNKPKPPILPTIQINKTAFYPAPQKTLGILQKIHFSYLPPRWHTFRLVGILSASLAYFPPRSNKDLQGDCSVFLKLKI
jgi:hypothetical protein